MKLPVWSRIFPEGVGNYRRRRFLQTGKGFWVERHTRGLRSSLPVYRNRINRATGRPRADDAEIYGRRDARLASARMGGKFDPSRAWENSADAYRNTPARRVDPHTPHPELTPEQRQRRNDEFTARHNERCQSHGNARSR
jgi:hypothetical protein